MCEGNLFLLRSLACLDEDYFRLVLFPRPSETFTFQSGSCLLRRKHQIFNLHL